MKKHYVYRITNKNSNKHYYGIRSSEIEPKMDLGIKYFSSSSDKEFIQDQKQTPEIFKYKIVKIFETRLEATQFEIALHKKFNVGVNESFYNKVIQTSIGFDTSGTTHKRNPHTEESKAKISKGNLGKKHTEETKQKLSEIHKGKNLGKKRSEETKQKISETQKGRIFTDEHRLKIAETKRIKKGEFPEYESLGWLKGRKMKW